MKKVLYHGGVDGINKFMVSHGILFNNLGKGIYFTDSYKAACNYAKNSIYTVEVILKDELKINELSINSNDFIRFREYLKQLNNNDLIEELSFDLSDYSGQEDFDDIMMNLDGIVNGLEGLLFYSNNDLDFYGMFEKCSGNYLLFFDFIEKNYFYSQKDEFNEWNIINSADINIIKQQKIDR